jgi:hypothetical protein
MDDSNIADKVVSDIKKDFVAVGAHRVHGWYAWAIVGIVFGMALGIVYVANRSAQFDASQASMLDSNGDFSNELPRMMQAEYFESESEQIRDFSSDGLSGAYSNPMPEIPKPIAVIDGSCICTSSIDYKISCKKGNETLFVREQANSRIGGDDDKPVYGTAWGLVPEAQATPFPGDGVLKKGGKCASSVAGSCDFKLKECDDEAGTLADDQAQTATNSFPGYICSAVKELPQHNSACRVKSE